MKGWPKVTIRVETDDELVEARRDDIHVSVAFVHALAAVADRMGDEKLERLAQACRTVMEREYGWTVGSD